METAQDRQVRLLRESAEQQAQALVAAKQREQEANPVPRTKLLKGKRWPKDRYGDEIDIGDVLMFVDWTYYPTAKVGKVVRVGKTGKVHVEIIKLHPKDEAREVEIKECTSTSRLSPVVVNSFMLEKLSRPD